MNLNSAIHCKSPWEHWSDFLGFDVSEFQKNSLLIVPHRTLVNYNGAVIFRCENLDVISVPSELLSSFSKLDFLRDKIFDQDYLRKIIPIKIERFVGPAYQGYVTPQIFIPHTAAHIRPYAPTDANLLAIFASACDPLEWEHSSISLQHTSDTFVYDSDGTIVAAANFRNEDVGTASIGVITHPLFRGKGFGLAAASFAIEKALSLAYLVCWQTLLSNEVSIRIAEKLGCKDFARTLAIRFENIED